ncbi:cora-like Mg2+ transporter protein-domain-containing protein [Bombardia bombarda]|uniref:Cora-like Mg2+ transporter protein-domain-containing protein n=1 Tax=Bombardia bombarda TaxID=252184 RepID=A0AA39WCK8_9PEZI|nr:cora-like Mg2+ transporter protein-domain-containing protein [Bombardia bombarda]
MSTSGASEEQDSEPEGYGLHRTDALPYASDSGESGGYYGDVRRPLGRNGAPPNRMRYRSSSSVDHYYPSSPRPRPASPPSFAGRGYYRSYDYVPKSHPAEAERERLRKRWRPVIRRDDNIEYAQSVDSLRSRKKTRTYDVGVEPSLTPAGWGSGNAPEWKNRKLVQPDKNTELLLVHSLEHKVSRSKKARTVLVCPDRPQAPEVNSASSSVQIRWLHVQTEEPMLDVLEGGALRLFNQLSLQPSKLHDHNRAFCELGRNSEAGSQQNERVLLVSGRFLVLCPPNNTTNPSNSSKSTDTLLRFLYSYDFEPELELSQVVRKLGLGSSKDFVHIPSLTCLILGSGVLITMSSISRADITGDLVEIDNRATRGFHTVKVRRLPYGLEQPYNIVIEPDCSFVDFFRHAIAICTSGNNSATAYELLYEVEDNGHQRSDILTPSKWLTLLGSDTIEKQMFSVRPKVPEGGLRSRNRHSYHGKHTSYTRPERDSYDSSNSSSSHDDPPMHAIHPSVVVSASDIFGGFKFSSSSKEAPNNEDRKSKDVQQTSRPEVDAPRGNQLGSDNPNAGVKLEDDAIFTTEPIPEPETASRKAQSSSNATSENLPVSTSTRQSTRQSSTRPPSSRQSHQRSLYEDGLLISGYSSDVDIRISKSPVSGDQTTNYLRPRREAASRPRTSSDSKRDIETEQAPAQTSGVVTSPFFTWRVKSGNGLEDIGIEETTETLFRILAKVDNSMASEESGLGQLYTGSFRCAIDDLLGRHPGLVVDETKKISLEKPEEKGGSEQGLQHPMSIVPNIDPVASGDANDKTLSGEGLKIGDDVNMHAAQAGPLPEHQVHHENEPSSSKQEVRPRQSLEILHRGQASNKQLLEVSQSLMWAFVPKDRAASYHPVCERLWGSVDAIFRQVEWSTGRALGVSRWVVRDFDTSWTPTATVIGDNAYERKYADCNDCKGRTEYASIGEAMAHLHSKHFDCSYTEEADNRTHDDPCYVWLKNTCEGKEVESAILIHVDDCVKHLTNMSRTVNELQWLVATNSRDQHGNNSSTRPQLPSNLVYAFEEIVCYYIITARRLSIMNRLAATSDRTKINHLEQRVIKMNFRSRDVLDRINRFLRSAKKEVILAGAGGYEDADTLGVKSVGIEFLVAALLTAVQNRPIGNAPKPTNTNFETGLDVVDLYRKYSAHLRFEANRRPQRRVFLDIHALEDELAALRAVLASQRDTLDKYVSLIQQQDGFRTRNTRRELSRFELQYIMKQQDLLEQRDEAILDLQKSAQALKQRVKQMIEIMDEDHGKAIRVFTIVTVFFLPLSFVTGFFGMNTSDIRDLDAGQTLYWTVAIPVTVVILFLAFIYGYRGDEIQDWIRKTMGPGSGPKSARPGPRRRPDKKVEKERWRDFSTVWNRNRIGGKKQSGVVKRPTYDSMLS